jgi:hypothetical protein
LLIYTEEFLKFLVLLLSSCWAGVCHGGIVI